MLRQYLYHQIRHCWSSCPSMEYYELSLGLVEIHSQPSCRSIFLGHSEQCAWALPLFLWILKGAMPKCTVQPRWMPFSNSRAHTTFFFSMSLITAIEKASTVLSSQLPRAKACDLFLYHKELESALIKLEQVLNTQAPKKAQESKQFCQTYGCSRDQPGNSRRSPVSPCCFSPTRPRGCELSAVWLMWWGRQCQCRPRWIDILQLGLATSPRIIEGNEMDYLEGFLPTFCHFHEWAVAFCFNLVE